MSSAPVFLPLLLDRIKRSQTRITRSCENHIGAFTDLRQGNLLSFSRVVPGTVCHTNIVLNHTNVRLYRASTFFIAGLETMNQTNIHASEKPYRAGPAC